MLATVGAILTIVCYVLLGFKKIETGHIGQGVLFGVRRVKGLTFNEGLTWLPFGLMSIKIVDARVGKKTLQAPFVFSKDNVRVSFTVAYWLRIIDPYLYLGTKAEEIFDGINDVMGRKTRLFILEHKGVECRRMSEELCAQLEAEAREVVLRWGIEIQKLAVTDVNYAPEYEEALEAEKKREYCIKADAKEIQNLTKRTQKLKKTLGLSAEKAVETDQVQTGKIQKRVSKHDIGENVIKAFSGGFGKMGEEIGKKVGEVVGKIAAEKLSQERKGK